ncbi:MAG: DUF2071 domain-containing protein [Planctomycetes bacterium]|jgi:hypothetical protein|nr:DUF2071 domain-containing protein [Planctomycetota bacterium]
MRIPLVKGVIERRVLVNYRVDPEVLQRHVPAPFTVQQVNGHGIAGVCLIRLAQVRPRLWPRALGLRSENAAHRVAVTWPTADGGQREGVYVNRRDTSSVLNAWLGGRFFPGRHHRASFDVAETPDSIAIALRSADGHTHISVRGRIVEHLPSNSLFPDVETASSFFERGAVGYSPSLRKDEYDCLELRSLSWRVQPIAIDHVESSWLEDQSLFPKGSVEFDSALWMRNIEHEWHAHASIDASGRGAM